MESPSVQQARALIAEELETKKRFARIFPGLVASVKSDAMAAGTCTITGDTVMSLWQYLLRLSSIGDWKIDPLDRTSLIPTDYNPTPTLTPAFSGSSNAIRLLAFTNQFLTTSATPVVATTTQGVPTTVVTQPPALPLITNLSQLESAFNNHANQAAIVDATAKGIPLNLVSYRPLREFGKEPGQTENFFSTAGNDVSDWRIVRARRVRPVSNAWGTVVANIELTLASPRNYTLPLLFGDKDQIVFCELDVGEDVRRPYALPEPGLEPLCPDQTTARTWSVMDIVNIIKNRVQAGTGSWVTQGSSVIAKNPAVDGIPVLQVSGFIPGFGSKGRETTNHGNFRLTGITEVAAPFSLDAERQYILTFAFLGMIPGSNQIVETSQVQVYGDQSLLIYGCL